MNGLLRTSVLVFGLLGLTGCALDLLVHDRRSDAGNSDAGLAADASDLADVGSGPADASSPFDAGSEPDAGHLADGGPAAAHPRLWITGADLPRLRGWATGTNPVFQAGLASLATRGIGYMDNPPAGVAGNRLPGEDTGAAGYSPYPCEAWAHLFAFLSQVHPDSAARADFADRARRLLMHVIDEADKGAASGEPFRHPNFALGDRARSMGQAFPLTVDWIYGALDASEKAKIRRVFLRWAGELAAAPPSPYPASPTVAELDRVNDPALLDLGDPKHRRVRQSVAPDWTLHLRNLGLMALALDPADDLDDPAIPGDDAGELGRWLRRATGAFLYVTDQALRTDAAGGLSPDGFDNTPESLGYPLQFLFALETAGQADSAGQARWGPQVAIDQNPFWSRAEEAWLHALAPVMAANPDYGSVAQPANWGATTAYLAQDPIAAFGPLGLHARASGRLDRLDAIRWLQQHLAPGGTARLGARAGAEGALTPANLYFLLFSPDAPPPSDPRPSLPATFSSRGAGMVLARTGWDAEARFLSYRLGWVTTDAQHGDGNGFAFYRKGEWLTKERSGAGYLAASSDYKNTLTIENDVAGVTLGTIPGVHAARGAQFILGDSAGDPPEPSHSATDAYVFVEGDATNLYNFDDRFRRIEGVLQATRSLVWLPPDRLVVFDRARTKSAGRTKRFWLTLPGTPTLTGPLTTATTAGGQQLFVTTLLPEGAAATLVSDDPTVDALGLYWSFADFDPMNHDYSFPGHPQVPGATRLRVEATGAPADARFLHVLQGADPGSSPETVQLVRSSAGTSYVGAVVGNAVVLFPDQPGAFGSLTYQVPGSVTRHVISGLAPGAGYSATTTPASGTVTVTLAAGGPLTADGAGVLVF